MTVHYEVCSNCYGNHRIEACPAIDTELNELAHHDMSEVIESEHQYLRIVDNKVVGIFSTDGRAAPPGEYIALDGSSDSHNVLPGRLRRRWLR